MNHVFTVSKRIKEEQQGYSFYTVILEVSGNAAFSPMPYMTIAVTAKEFEKCPLGARFELAALFGAPSAESGACPDPKGSGPVPVPKEAG